MYLNRPPITTHTEGRLAIESYSKLLSVRTGPFHVVEISPTTVRIDEYRIHSLLSLDQATVAPAVKPTPTKDTRTQGDETAAERKETCAGDMRPQVKNVANAPQENPMDHIVRRVGEGQNVLYVMRCYTATR